MSLDVRQTVRGVSPRIPYGRMVRHVLGETYELSLVVCGDTLARRVNKKYRKKSYAPNVLSFPLTHKEGEIFLNLRKAEREARTYGVSLRARTALLFVHALWHLKGFDHGGTMRALEAKTLRRFGF